MCVQKADPDSVDEGRKRSILNVLLLLGIVRGPATTCSPSGVPREIWRQAWSSNTQERLNCELRRRTDVVRASEKSQEVLDQLPQLGSVIIPVRTG